MPSERFESQGEGRPGSQSEERMPPESEDHVSRTTEDRGESVGEPDVLLDVPVLNVEELDLEVEDLRARISFQAELADMVKINVGIDAEVGTAKIEVQGIEAQAQLKARLDNVRAIFSEVLTALQRDPELAQNMLRTSGPLGEIGRETGESADRAGTVAREAESATNTGATSEEGRRTGQGIADDPENEAKTSTGGSDSVVGEEGSSNLANLRIEEEYVDDRGRIVGVARDESGKVVEEILDGNVLDPEAPAGTEPGEDQGAEATDAARRRAGELGLDLSGVEGTGFGGRILVRDVEAAGRDER